MTHDQMPEGWWRSFFVGSHLDYHRARWKSTGDAARDVDRIVALASLRPGDAVLDVPCGSGRHAHELAQRGLQVVGIDACPEFVDEARLRARCAGHHRARFACRDMRDLPFTACFDAVICMGGSFGYFGQAGDAGFLRRCTAALRPGGWLLIDAATLETVLRVHEPTASEQFGNLQARHWRRLDPARGVVRLDLTVISGAAEHTRSYHQRLYRHDELRHMVRRAGCTVSHCCGADGEPFGPASRRLLLVAQRPHRTAKRFPA